MCVARKQPVEACMSCGGKCVKKICALGSDDPARVKECFSELKQDGKKKAAVKMCYKECIGTDAGVEEVEEDEDAYGQIDLMAANLLGFAGDHEHHERREFMRHWEKQDGAWTSRDEQP
jgi:hypothetical protein